MMIVLTFVFTAIYFTGGEIPNQAHDTPVYTDLLLNWTWILMIISIVLTVGFAIFQLFVNPKAAIKGLLGLGILGLIILVSYGMSDGTLLDMPGYTGPDNTPGTLKFADTVLNTMYILGVGTLLAIVVTEVIRKLR
ncbi:MAG: hypothetical protein ACEPOZ_14120 [Marinifilaceae bacterium]